MLIVNNEFYSKFDKIFDEKFELQKKKMTCNFPFWFPSPNVIYIFLSKNTSVLYTVSLF